MKTNTLPIAAFLATLVAVLLLPVGAAAACMALTATGVLSVFLADYGRTMEPLRVYARITPFDAPSRTAAELREAA